MRINLSITYNSYWYHHALSGFNGHNGLVYWEHDIDDISDPRYAYEGFVIFGLRIRRVFPISKPL